VGSYTEVYTPIIITQLRIQLNSFSRTPAFTELA